LVLLLLVHAAFFVVRIPFAGALPLPTDTDETRTGWWTFVLFDGVFFAFAYPTFLGAAARERMVLGYKRASLIDPLTGVGNRRAFFERAEKPPRKVCGKATPAVPRRDRRWGEPGRRSDDRSYAVESDLSHDAIVRARKLDGIAGLLGDELEKLLSSTRREQE
jgi:hypothetical protein